MTPPDFGAILMGAVKTETAMIWASWPTWAHEHPTIWIIPIAMVASVVRALWPKKR